MLLQFFSSFSPSASAATTIFFYEVIASVVFSSTFEYIIVVSVIS